MSFGSQFSLGLELTNVFPIGAGLASVATHLLNFARELRKSGSDIVVEEDLASIFGRGNIETELESKFKATIKERKFVDLFSGSEIRLDSGPGPTMHRALKERRYLATVIQLSLLAWMQSREELAAMLARCMRKRVEMNVQEASNPGVEGLAMTLETCNSQTTEFAWSFYIQQVESRLRSCYLDYQFHRDYIRMTDTLLLGAMDYLYLVQNLPDHRKILISNQIGCITLVVWAHYVLGLTVLITRGKVPIKQLIFGTSEEPQVILQWQECGGCHHVDDRFRSYADMCSLPSPEIRLLNEDRSVILRTIPSSDFGHIAQFCNDRHPLLGYGSATLHRMFNARIITPENDPIYEDTATLTAALAIHVSTRLDRKFDSQFREECRLENLPPHPIQIEVWRVLASAKVIFSGIKHNPRGIAAYVEFLADSKFDEENVPPNFMKYLKAATQRDASIPHVEDFVEQVKYLTRVVLLFACVADVESCATMPVILHCAFVEMRSAVQSICWGPNTRPAVASESIFRGIAQLLRDDITDLDPLHQDENLEFIFLLSYFGWSVFLDTIGDKDPAETIPYLIHIQKGVPTDTTTNERRFIIADGSYGRFSFNLPKIYGMPGTEMKKSLPRAAARVTRRREFWTIRPRRFEMILIMTIEESPDGDTNLNQHDIKRLEDWISCRSMHSHIWETFQTPSCNHEVEIVKPGIPLNLGPDARAVVGWCNEAESLDSGPYPQRVLVFLTRDDARARWLAVSQATLATGGPELNDKREIMLRTKYCCDQCALEYVFSLSGRWVLIL